MFCPRCGSNQSDDLKFCKSCGANLYAVSQVIDTRETSEKFDWDKTWVADIFRSAEEKKRRKAGLQRKRGITPEIKRYVEIKAGVITASAGLALAAILYVLMEGLILGGKVSLADGEILSRLWIAGVAPLFVGMALIVNGLFVSKKMVDAARRGAAPGPSPELPEANPNSLPGAEATEFIPSGFSVTEETTKHLRNSD